MHHLSRTSCCMSALSGMGAPLVFALVSGSLGLIQPGYDPVTQLMSELGVSSAPHAGIMNLVGFGLTGFLITLFSVSLYSIAGERWPGAIGSGLVALCGLFFIGMAAFSCDSGCVPVTLAGRIHLQLGLAALLVAVGASLLIGYSLRGTGSWGGYWQYSLCTGAGVLLLLQVFISAPVADGLVQRIMVGALFLWMEILSIGIYRRCGKGKRLPG